MKKLFKFITISEKKYETGDKTHDITFELDSPTLVEYFKNNVDDSVASTKIISNSNFFGKAPFNESTILEGESIPFNIKVMADKSSYIKDNKIQYRIDLTYAGKNGYEALLCNNDNPKFFLVLNSKKISTSTYKKIARVGILNDIVKDLNKLLEMAKNNYINVVDGKNVIDDLIVNLKELKNKL